MQKTQRGRPTKEDKLVQKSIKVDPDKWDEAKAKANDENISLNAIIRLLIDAWIDEDVQMTMRGKVKVD